MDSRVYQSKVRITEALLRLMESDDFSALTVSELTAHAHVSRNTFYRHFTDKYSVVEFFVEWLLDSYLAEVRRQGVTDFESLLVLYFTFWKERRKYIGLLKRHHLLDMVFDVQRKKFLRALPGSSLPWHGIPGVDETCVNLIVIGGMWTVLLYWLEGGMKLEASDITHRILRELRFYTQYIGDRGPATRQA